MENLAILTQLAAICKTSAVMIKMIFSNCRYVLDPLRQAKLYLRSLRTSLKSTSADMEHGVITPNFNIQLQKKSQVKQPFQ